MITTKCNDPKKEEKMTYTKLSKVQLINKILEFYPNLDYKTINKYPVDCMRRLFLRNVINTINLKSGEKYEMETNEYIFNSSFNEKEIYNLLDEKKNEIEAERDLKNENIRNLQFFKIEYYQYPNTRDRNGEWRYEYAVLIGDWYYLKNGQKKFFGGNHIYNKEKIDLRDLNDEQEKVLYEILIHLPKKYKRIIFGI
ncbi:hypothetical protein [Faecalicoccus pleomorphus]|uniref:hypothetical protein n=1 Tax=Faecalicoccus pleomorphus TaxID=1323 RepID=UPI0026F0BD2A|nr:hypothetical protein [Faecalicoccus pleomorphus]